MKKLFTTSILCIMVSVLIAQDLTITFQSIVDSVSIDSISATNLRTNQTVKLLGGESLLLVKTPTSINRLNSTLEMGYLYPNPTDGDATFSFSMDKSEEVEIRMYNSNGQLLRVGKENLSQGMHNFSIKFPVAGIYYLTVIKRDEIPGFKAVYTGRKTQNSSIVYEGSEILNSSVSNENQLKGAITEKSLAYTEYDIIQYSFFSGLNTTIISEVPSVSKTVDVEFVSCVDNDNRSYKVVQIGNQCWMAENLAYDVGNGCWAYNNDESNVATYGRLYTWEAAKAACPTGWHLPTDDEWTELNDYLGGINVAGGKLKETGTTHWNSPNTGATNETGFSALPGGSRGYNGLFVSVGNLGAWWSATEHIAGYARYRIMYSTGPYLGQPFNFMDSGYSVRCVRD